MRSNTAKINKGQYEVKTQQIQYFIEIIIC